MPTASAQASATRQRRKEARPGELLEAALALFVEKGFAATRFDAPQHVDINAFADDGIQLLEVKRELEIDGKTRVLGWQSGGAARIEQFAKIFSDETGNFTP